MKREEIEGYTLDIDATGIEAEKESAKMTYKGYKGYMPIVGHLKEYSYSHKKPDIIKKMMCFIDPQPKQHWPANVEYPVGAARYAIDFLDKCNEENSC